MHIGVTSYSFASDTACGKLNLFDIPARVKELGFEGVEFAGIAEDDPDVDIVRLKDVCEAAQIPVCGYCTSADFTADIPTQMKWIREEADRAAYLGSPVLRTDIYHSIPQNPFAQPVIGALRELASYAASKGVVLTTENHGGYFCASDRLLRLCREVNHENFGVLADTGNFQDGWEDPAKALAALTGFIRHVHLKDCHMKDGSAFYPGEGWYVTAKGDYLRPAILGHGCAPVYKCLKILSRTNYDGWLTIEYEGIEDVTLALRLSLANARRLLEYIPLGMYHE